MRPPRPPPALLRARDRGGAHLLEFALTLPVFLSLMLGMIEFGWFFFQKAAIDSAVHIGCRQGAVLDPGTNDAALPANILLTVQGIKDVMAENGVVCDGCSVQVVDLYNMPARSLSCTVSQEYIPLVNVIDAVPITSRAIVRMEIQR